jgi:hypothetical protein
MRKLALVTAIAVALVLGAIGAPSAHAQQRNPGISTVCGEYKIVLFVLLTPLGPIVLGPDFPDEGWAYVDGSRKRVQATGIAHNVKMASNDTPANHFSHDLDFEVRLDPGQTHLLSTQAEDSLPIEWEAGVRPNEKTGDGAHPIFPKRAWPSEGDRIWVDGNWIFDCGHPTDDGLYKTEIHPARALATMRDVAAPIPGTGTTPVPVTMVDLHITGKGGFAPNQLNCGPDIIIGDHGSTCGQDPAPEDDSYKTTPINDTDFSFDVCLPARPRDNAVVKWRVESPSDNTVQIDPVINVVNASGFCVSDPGVDHLKMLRVTAPLRGTATPPTAVMSRRIHAGWVVAPDEVLPHRKVTLKNTDLHEDHDLDPGDGELTFWWLNLNRAENAWFRLSDFATGNMDDYDDDFSFGDGIMHYNPNASFDFYLRHDQAFHIRSRGFEQDCFDNIAGGAFYGYPHLELAMYLACYADLPDFGAGDGITDNNAAFNATDLGDKNFGSGDYDITVNIEEVPLAFEDTSYLTIGTACVPASEVAATGQPITCSTRLNNNGPGLPRSVRVKSDVSGASTPTLSSGTWTIPGPFGNGTYACSTGAVESNCHPDSVPVAVSTPVNITTIAVPSAPGLFTQRAEVTTNSTDPDLTDNAATASMEVFQSIVLDILPQDPENIVHLDRGEALMAVAILTNDTFNAATIDPATVCFGDADAPPERACGVGNVAALLRDVNGDKRADLVLTFVVGTTGIDSGDTGACLRGRTFNGIGVFGCGPIVTKK